MDLLSLGHPAPLLIVGGEALPIVVASGLPLGLPERQECPPTPVILPDGWRLLFYTDGLTEGLADHSSRERYGLTRLLATVGRLSQVESTEKVLDRILDDASDANGGPLADDVTMLLVSHGDGGAEPSAARVRVQEHEAHEARSHAVGSPPLHRRSRDHEHHRDLGLDAARRRRRNEPTDDR